MYDLSRITWAWPLKSLHLFLSSEGRPTVSTSDITGNTIPSKREFVSPVPEQLFPALPPPSLTRSTPLPIVTATFDYLPAFHSMGNLLRNPQCPEPWAAGLCYRNITYAELVVAATEKHRVLHLSFSSPPLSQMQFKLPVELWGLDLSLSAWSKSKSLNLSVP